VPHEEAEGPHLKIGAVAELLGIRPHVLRYWEAEFRELRPKKTRGAHRMYGPRELRIARTIHRLIYAEGYTVAGAKRRLGELLREDARPEPAEPSRPKLVSLDSRRPPEPADRRVAVTSLRPPEETRALSGAPRPEAPARPEPENARPEPVRRGEPDVISAAEGRAIALRSELLGLRAELVRLAASLEALEREPAPQHHAVVEAVIPSARRRP
jgi:DNA-binding transcriptional MerR regulator